MKESIREKFNSEFSQEKYHQFLRDISLDFDYAPTFRIAETPFFIPKELEIQLLEACDEVISFVKRSDFKVLTQRAIELNTEVPNEDEHTQFLAIDFGICEENGQVIPKLIEVQGFPSIFNFQYNLFRKIQKFYPFLSEMTPYPLGMTEDSYLAMLKRVIFGKWQQEEVVLLEIEPEKQNTKIDFYYAQRDLGIKILCVTDVLKDGKKLFYLNSEGQKIQIKRIYNRVIFDELFSRQDLRLQFSFEEELEVEWAGHPNWYTRISKFILPYLKGP